MMKRYIKATLASLLLVTSLSFVFAVPTTHAINVDPFKGACDGGTSGSTGGTPGTSTPGQTTPSQTGGSGSSSICDAAKGDSLQGIMKNVINVILVILGTIAVIMIIIGGIRYTTSNGDASGIKGAKDTILYAVVGLVVAILAFAIVNFVLGAFAGK